MIRFGQANAGSSKRRHSEDRAWETGSGASRETDRIQIFWFGSVTSKSNDALSGGDLGDEGCIGLEFGWGPVQDSRSRSVGRNARHSSQPFRISGSSDFKR